MIEPLVFGIYILSVVAGALIGLRKNRLASGIIWTLCFSWIGFIIVLCLPDRNPKADTDVKALIEYQKFHQAKAREEKQKAQEALRIARGGQDLGSMDLPRIKLMLRQGELSLQDYYFDDMVGDWQPLELHPDFASMAV